MLTYLTTNLETFGTSRLHSPAAWKALSWQLERDQLADVCLSSGMNDTNMMMLSNSEMEITTLSSSFFHERESSFIYRTYLHHRPPVFKQGLVNRITRVNYITISFLLQNRK